MSKAKQCDEYCPACGNDVDDMTDAGICEECLWLSTATAKRLRDRRTGELIDMLEQGHDVDLTGR